MRKLSVCAILLALLLCMMLPVAHADVGNFAGDSDWGDSGSYDSGSDYSWDDDDDDYGSTWSGSDGGSSGGSSSGEGWSMSTLVIMGVVIVLLILSAKRSKGGKNAPVQVNTAPKAADLSVLLKNDPDFDVEKFLEKVRNLYVQMQNAWTAKDWEPMRPSLTDAFFNQLGRQLEEMKKAGRTNHVERIAVLGATVTGYERRDNLDQLKVWIQTRICDYTTDDATGEVVSGDKNRELFMTYEWTMVRTAGAVTKKEEGAASCPNCGAPLDANASYKCPYCGSVIQGTDYDWTLASIRGISQRSNG